MKLKKIDKPTLATLRMELEDAINVICKEYGLKPTTLGNITFTNNSFSTSKLNFQIDEIIDYKAMGLSLIGKEFKHNSTLLEVIAINPDGLSVTCETGRGKKYKVPFTQLSTFLRIY